MADMKHTPGPWTVIGPIGAGIWITDESGNNQIAVVYGAANTPGADANARLIAAAPELYEALKLICAMFDDRRIVRNIANDYSSDWALRMLEFTKELQSILAALAKAEGRS